MMRVGSESRDVKRAERPGSALSCTGIMTRRRHCPLPQPFPLGWRATAAFEVSRHTLDLFVTDRGEGEKTVMTMMMVSTTKKMWVKGRMEKRCKKPFLEAHLFYFFPPFPFLKQASGSARPSTYSVR